MAAADFELRTVEWTTARIAVVGLALVSAAIHFALAATTGSEVFALLALGLLAGFVIFFTELWSPVLYLLGAIFVGIMTVVWILAGTPVFWLGAFDKVVQSALFVLFAYLFVVEQRVGEEAPPPE